VQVALPQDISFGDCDPARVLRDPNAFRWMDVAFHALLRRFGGHWSSCQSLDAVGMGLVDASARSGHAMRDGDRRECHPSISGWAPRSFTLDYAEIVESQWAFEGRQVRYLFTRRKTGIVAPVAPLRALSEACDDR